MMHSECHEQGQVSLASSTPKLSHPIYDAGKIPPSLMSCFLSRFISKIIRSLANEKTSIEESSIDSVFDAMFLLPFSILDRRPVRKGMQACRTSKKNSAGGQQYRHDIDFNLDAKSKLHDY